MKIIKKQNKKGMAPILVAISFVASFITILYFAGYIEPASIFNLASITGSGEYIERPVFYYDKCEAVGSLTYSTAYSLATDGQWLNKPSATDSYNVKINIPSSELFYTYPQIEYWICNSRVQDASNCRVVNNRIPVTYNSVFTISDVRPNEYVFAQYQAKYLSLDLRGRNGATYQVGFVPFGIRQYNVLGGSANPVVPNSCTYSTTPTDTILFTDADDVNSYKPLINTNERTLQPNEVRWYVAGYLTSKAESFELSYNGKNAWCRPTGSGAEIYQINTIKTSGGTYKIASVDWSDYLGSEKCCPAQVQGDLVCNDNFEWEQIQGTECGIFKSCGSPNWVPYSTNTLIKYSCVNGYCISETKSVECASDYDCKDINQICDLNTWTCVNADVYLDGDEIITIPDNKMDCEEKGGTWITETSEEKDLLDYLGITEPEIVVQEYCKMPRGINYFLWISIAVIIVILVMFRNQLFAGFRFILSKIGVRI